MLPEHTLKSFDKDLHKLYTNILDMFSKSRLQINIVFECLKDASGEDLNHSTKDIIGYKKEAKIIEDRINRLCIKILSLRNPLAGDLRFVFAATHIANNLGLISDLTHKIIKNINELSTYEVEQDILNSCIEMITEEIKLLQIVENMFTGVDTTLLNNSYHALDDNIDLIYKKVNNAVFRQYSQKDYSGNYNSLSMYLYIAKKLENIGDYCINIIKYIYFIEYSNLE